MKVYLEVGNNSRGLMRVRDALVRYAPSSVEVVNHSREADLDVIHVFGRHDAVERRINKLRAENKPYAMIQYCLRSTMNPSTKDWFDMWFDSRLVWSYYDLPTLCREDEIATQFHDGSYTMPAFRFYYAPLGVDPEVFQDMNFYADPKEFTIGASAQHALSEGVRECFYATQRVKGKMFHLGHELRRGPQVVCKTGLTDEEVAQMWSKCRFVSGLRRVEGFELPIIEGALCGARPIVFDRPEMRKWFNEFAIFIPEGSRAEVIDSLEKVFTGFYGEINENDKMLIRDRFNWETIIKGFWERIL